MPLVRTPLVALILALPLLAAASVGQGGNPDSLREPPEDGCERNPGGLVAGTSPQWVFVNGDDAPRYAAGIVRESRPTYTDLFSSHDGYDMNVFLLPDEPHASLLATANLAGGGIDEIVGGLEVEWEESAYPPFAWPTAGDRMEALGAWIWDCGHWGETDPTNPAYLVPGAQPGEEVTGEATEIHPARMIAVHRSAPSTSERGAAVTDVLISSKGTRAWGVLQHAAGRCEAPTPVDCPRWVPVNDRDYEILVQAPPRPPGATRMTWEALDRGSVNAPDPVVEATASGIRVRIPLKGWGNAGDEITFAQSFHVGWDVPREVRHLRVHLERLEWLAELDTLQPFACVPVAPCSGEAQASHPPDEVNVYVEAAGQWRRLDVAGLLAVKPGDAFELDETFDLYLDPGKPWRVYGMGRECDQPSMRECAAPTEFGLNDDGGIFSHEYAGVAPAVGDHVGEGASGPCEKASGGPCYRLTYRIEDLGMLRPSVVPASPLAPRKDPETPSPSPRAESPPPSSPPQASPSAATPPPASPSTRIPVPGAFATIWGSAFAALLFAVHERGRRMR